MLAQFCEKEFSFWNCQESEFYDAYSSLLLVYRESFAPEEELTKAE